MSESQEPKIELTHVFARTSRGQSEALDAESALTPMLRHLLILLDGRAPLSELQSYYPHKDITVAALLLWHHGYAEPVLSNNKPGLLRKLLWGKSADAVAPQVSSQFFIDSLQSVFPNSESTQTKPRFSESGKYWFSPGGMALSQDAKDQMQDKLHLDKGAVKDNPSSEHIDIPLDKP